MRTTPPQLIEDFTRRGWWGERSLVTLFDDAVRSVPKHLALVDQFNRSEFSDGEPLRLTFGELSDAVDAIATGLYQHGIRQEDIVVVQLPNIAELPALYLALARLGVVVKPDESVTLGELTDFLRQHGLAVFKLPEQLRCTDELPRNATGKVLRRELKGLFDSQ